MRHFVARDQIIEEIHAIREVHAAEFGYDLKAMFDDIRRQGYENRHPVVSLRDRAKHDEAQAHAVMDKVESYDFDRSESGKEK